MGRQRSSARIDSAPEQSDGAVHADGDIGAGDVKALRDLLVRVPLVETQLDDLAVDSRQEIADTDWDTVERHGGFDVVMEKIVQWEQENRASNGRK